MRRLVLAALLLCAAAGAYRAWLLRPSPQPPGVIVAGDPDQGELGADAPSFKMGDYDIMALASYHLRARLLGREPYHFHREAELSPMDFAVGWGPMSDTAVIDQLELKQGSRYFTMRWRDPPLSEDAIFRHAANMHLIPADATVRRALDRMRPGEIVELDGYLVRATARDGWSWSSSLTRADRGAGACELMWVQQAR
jgi:hypothetical protein